MGIRWKVLVCRGGWLSLKYDLAIKACSVTLFSIYFLTVLQLAVAAALVACCDPRNSRHTNTSISVYPCWSPGPSSAGRS